MVDNDVYAYQDYFFTCSAKISPIRKKYRSPGCTVEVDLSSQILHASFHGVYPYECFPEPVGANFYQFVEAVTFDYELLIPFFQIFR